MFKVWASGSIRRIGQSLLRNRCSDVEKNRTLFRCYERRLIELYKARGNQYSTCAHNLSLRTRETAVTHHAQLAWKRLSKIFSYRGATFPQKNAIGNTRLASTSSLSVAMGISAIFLIYSTQGKGHYSGGAEDFSSVNTCEHVKHAVGGWTLWREKSMFIFKLSIKHVVLFCRAMYLAFLFAPTIALAPFAESFGVPFREEWLRLVYATLEKAGPAFIAWGQWAATRPDLFSRDLCMTLSKLPTVAPEHSFAYTKNTIEKAFDRKLSELFDDLEETPVSSGSVVQVHRATLKFRYPGREVKPIVVAVKVQHPGIRESLERDFVIMQWFVKIANINSTLRWLKLEDRVQRVAGFMMSQVDLLKKAELLGHFGYNFCGFEGISFPKPLYPLVHPDVSVETFEEGETVSHYIDADVKLGHETKNDLVYRGTFAFLNMFMVNNFVHAGMHSGNILLRLQKGKPHIIFSDVGMTAELSASERATLAKLMQSVGTRDGRVAAISALSLSKKQTCPDPNAFVEDVEKSFNFWDSKEGGFINPYECMQRLLEKVRVHRVHIDDNVGTVMGTILALEDWQRKLFLHSEHRVMQTFHLFGPPPDLFPLVMTQSRSERGKRSLKIVD